MSYLDYVNTLERKKPLWASKIKWMLLRLKRLSRRCKNEAKRFKSKLLCNWFCIKKNEIITIV